MIAWSRQPEKKSVVNLAPEAGIEDSLCSTFVSKISLSFFPSLLPKEPWMEDASLVVVESV